MTIKFLKIKFPETNFQINCVHEIFNDEYESSTSRGFIRKYILYFTRKDFLLETSSKKTKFEKLHNQ